MPTASRCASTRRATASPPPRASTSRRRSSGTYTLADGRKAVPVFQLMAERYLAPEYAPDTVAAEIGVAADTIRRIAAEMADVAFKQP